jgi:hypothetical protein
MSIPRDVTYYYCSRGEHEKCGIPMVCACPECLASIVAETAAEVAALSPWAAVDEEALACATLRRVIDEQKKEGRS